MTIYRARERATVWVEALGRDVTLDPAVDLDDSNPEDAAVIAAWAGRGKLSTPNVESATAAPGERRSTRRRPADG